MGKTVELLYFEGCPTYKTTLKDLEEIVRQEALDARNAFIILLWKIGIVKRRRAGNSTYYPLRDPRLLDALDNMRAVLSDILSERGSVIAKKEAGRI